MYKVLLIALIIISSNTFSIANSYLQPSDTCKLKVGINIGGASDYGTDWPFVDVMRFCRTWGTKNHPDYWTNQPWDTQLIDSIPKDAQGYPLQIPYNVTGADTCQIVYTVWAHTKAMPVGYYTFLYDGEGMFDFDLDAHVISSTQGRIIVYLDSSNNIAQMKIRYSNPLNHVRNIRFLMPGTEATYQTDPFNPTWLEKLAPFTSIRYMDWCATNFSPLEHWEDRAHIDDYTYSTAKGIPYEWIIKLSNKLNADTWVNIPHLADSVYILNMAQLFKDSLKTNLKIYVEYTNEWWNWMFSQTHYLLQHGDQNELWPERIAPFFIRCMNIWKSTFSSSPNRIERVFGTQHYWPDLGWRVLGRCPTGTFDALAPAAYIGLNGDTLNAIGAANTVETVLANAEHEFQYGAIPNWKAHRVMADSFGLRMHYYEGGQHFTPNPFGSVQPYNQALIDIQTDVRMYSLYTRLMDTLNTYAINGKSTFFHYVLSSPTSGQYGSWGALSSIYLTPPYMQKAPKYQALLDFINNCSGITPVEFSSFSGLASENKITLRWSTATEKNNLGFEIERINHSQRSDDWQKVGFVDGAGNSTSIKNYTFTDLVEGKGIYSYRLKQVDVSGEYHYSTVLEINSSAPNYYSLEQNYPNPFNPTTKIAFSIPKQERVTIKVFNLIGEEVALCIDEIKSAGNYTIDFNAKTLASGIYFYRINTTSGFNKVMKMSLLK